HVRAQGRDQPTVGRSYKGSFADSSRVCLALVLLFPEPFPRRDFLRPGASSIARPAQHSDRRIRGKLGSLLVSEPDNDHASGGSIRTAFDERVAFSAEKAFNTVKAAI